MKKLIYTIAIISSIIFGADTSKVVETHNNGNVSMISYYQDTEQGIELIKQETFHFTGSKSMVGTFKNGMRDGTWMYWYESGQKRLEGTYTQGFKDNLWTRYYPNGQIATKYYYDSKTLNGKPMEWHIDKECFTLDGYPCECGDNWWSECQKN